MLYLEQISNDDQYVINARLLLAGRRDRKGGSPVGRDLSSAPLFFSPGRRLPASTLWAPLIGNILIQIKSSDGSIIIIY